jgi:uncharacterized protein involved in outer membrane biogenesis
MGKLLKSKVFRVAAVLAALVGMYALLGFYAAPKLIRSKAVAFVHETYGRDLAIGEVRVNPFKLQLEIKDVAFPDADKQTMLGFKRLFIDFEASSLWNRAYTFKNIEVDAPAIRTVVRPDGQVNLDDLMLEEPPPPEPKPEDDKLPSVWIQSLLVSHGLADYIDQARATTYVRRFAPIEFSLQDFRTTPEGGDFGFSASGQKGGQFDYKGRFALEPGISSQGDFKIANVPATEVGDFLGDALPFGLTNGLINLAGHYELALGEETVVKVELPRIELSGLSLRAQGADADWVQVPNLTLSDTKVAMPEQTVSIANVTLASMTAQVWMAADGSINLTNMFSPAPSAAPAPVEAATTDGAAPAAPSPAPAAAAGPAATGGDDWTVQVGGVDVKDAAIDFEDRTLAPAARFTIAPLNVGLKDVSLDLGKPLPLVFDAKINGKGTMNGSGQITPDPLAADVDIAMADFDLRDVQPYADAATDLTIKGGTLAMKGKFAMTPPESADADMSFAGDVTVTGFKSIDNALEQDFFNFDRLELTRLRYDMGPDAMSIDRVSVVKPFNRVIISSNKVLNVAAVFDPQGTAAELKQREAADAAAAAEASRKKTRAEIRAEKKAAQAAAEARAKASPPPAPELKETGMPIRIRELRLENGRMDFADFSIQPNFAANITALNGSVTGMSSDPKARAKVDFKGKVGEFSPVTIAGDVQPFAYDRFTDIGMKFENISLPIFNPYSGKFAGYNIAKGKLTTDLHYTIQDRKLDAKHHIRIDQLEWGEATAEKSEASLPVKFATSLLKDADGVIDLDIPVTGTLDDPKFRIGPIIWQIIKNILTKAVTAPFKALGALFKDAEQAQFVDFAPGQTALDAPTAERLAGLAKTLAPKSDIRLSVPIGALAELDLASLTDQRYGVELQSAMEKVLRGKKASDDKPLPAFDTLEPGKRIEVLTALVQRVTGAPPQIPPPPAPPEGTSRKDAKALAESASIEYLQTEAHARLAAGAAELDKLGELRAETIQKALLTDTGLDPQRVFLVKDGKVTPQDGKVRFELGME